MKALFAACLGLAGGLLSLAASAQTIANLNLDTWAIRNGVEAPTNWQTTDDLFTAAFGISQALINTGAVVKSTDAHGGTYAAKLTTVSSLLGPAPGALILGTRVKVNLTANTGVAGLPYTTRPTQLQFYYKLTSAADQPLAGIILTRNVGGTRQVIGSGSLPLTASATYVLASIPIQYAASTAPDSVTVSFSTSSTATGTVGTTLLVDDVVLSSAALAVRADADVQAKLTVAPNPSTGGRFQLNAPDAPALASAPLLVSDMLGRTVAQQPALAAPSPTRELDLSCLSAGVYLLRIDSKDGTLVRQLTIK